MIDGEPKVINLYCDEEMPSSIDDESSNCEYPIDFNRKRKKLPTIESESDVDDSVDFEKRTKKFQQRIKLKYVGINNQSNSGCQDRVLDLRTESSSRPPYRSKSILKVEINDDDSSSVSDSDEYLSARRVRFLRRYTSSRRNSAQVLPLSRQELCSNEVTNMNEVVENKLETEENVEACPYVTNLKVSKESSCSMSLVNRKEFGDWGETSSSDSDYNYVERRKEKIIVCKAVNSFLTSDPHNTSDSEKNDEQNHSLFEEKEGNELSDSSVNIGIAMPSHPLNNVDENVGDCPICYKSLTDKDIGTPASCSHSFCLICLKTWANSVNTCPLDRRVFNMIFVRKYINGEIIQQIPVENRDLDTGEDTDTDSGFCEICRRNATQERLIVCDCCGRMYHLGCISPSVNIIPVTDWYCSDCSRFD